MALTDPAHLLICADELDELGFEREAKLLRDCYVSRTARLDLRRFCGLSTLYDTRTVFVRDGWKYASDGRIVVRIPAEEIPTYRLEPKRRLPTVENVFPRIFPKCMSPTPEEGVECFGHVLDDREFWKYCECRVHQCRTCFGTGKVSDAGRTCPVCSGSRRRRGYGQCSICLSDRPRVLCEFEGAFISRYHWALIRSLPGASLGAPFGKNRSLLPFEFHGGQGVVATLEFNEFELAMRAGLSLIQEFAHTPIDFTAG